MLWYVLTFFALKVRWVHLFGCKVINFSRVSVFCCLLILFLFWRYVNRSLPHSGTPSYELTFEKPYDYWIHTTSWKFNGRFPTKYANLSDPIFLTRICKNALASRLKIIRGYYKVNLRRHTERKNNTCNRNATLTLASLLYK